MRFAGDIGNSDKEAFQRRFLELDQLGRVPKSIVYPALLREFGGRIEVAEPLLADYRDRFSCFASEVEGASPVLAALRAGGLKLGIVTNGQTDGQSRTIDALAFGPMVDTVLISEREGIRKPDAEIFARAASRLGIEPAACLFVGDSPEADILGAHGAGMATVWLNNGAVWPDSLAPRPGRTISRLSELRVANPHRSS